MLWAILIGLLITNTFGLPRIFRAGVATYEFWLKVGIVLLGARFLLGDIVEARRRQLALVMLELGARARLHDVPGPRVQAARRS